MHQRTCAKRRVGRGKVVGLRARRTPARCPQNEQARCPQNEQARCPQNEQASSRQRMQARATCPISAVGTSRGLEL